VAAGQRRVLLEACSVGVLQQKHEMKGARPSRRSRSGMLQQSEDGPPRPVPSGTGLSITDGLRAIVIAPNPAGGHLPSALIAAEPVRVRNSQFVVRSPSNRGPRARFPAWYRGPASCRLVRRCLYCPHLYALAGRAGGKLVSDADLLRVLDRPEADFRLGRYPEAFPGPQRGAPVSNTSTAFVTIDYDQDHGHYYLEGASLPGGGCPGP